MTHSSTLPDQNIVLLVEDEPAIRSINERFFQRIYGKTHLQFLGCIDYLEVFTNPIWGVPEGEGRLEAVWDQIAKRVRAALLDVKLPRPSYPDDLLGAQDMTTLDFSEQLFQRQRELILQEVVSDTFVAATRVIYTGGDVKAIKRTDARLGNEIFAEKLMAMGPNLFQHILGDPDQYPIAGP